MKSKILSTVLVTILGLSFLAFAGSLNADEGGAKGCLGSGTKMEGKCCSKEMSAKMEKHKATMAVAVEKMEEHLTAMKEIRDVKQWRVEVENHMGMLQLLVEEMTNCPMKEMMHGGAHGEKGHEHPKGD